MKKKIVRTKLLFVLLFSIAIFSQIASAVVLRTNPNASIVLSFLGIVAWLSSCAFTALPFIKGVKYAGQKLWTKIQMYARMHIIQARRRKGKKKEAYASQEQVKRLRQNIDRLGLAMYGLTPEQERARRTHFKMIGEAVPVPVLPPQNAALYAEFCGLVRVLNHCGFPRQSVRLQDFEFLCRWGSDLETRLQQTQSIFANQQRAIAWMQDEACKVFERIGSTYPQAHADAGYQRVNGALKLLKKMACSSHCSAEEMLSYYAALMQDMDSLQKQLKEKVA